jgi:hypothetical protein
MAIVWAEHQQARLWFYPHGTTSGPPMPDHKLPKAANPGVIESRARFLCKKKARLHRSRACQTDTLSRYAI